MSEIVICIGECRLAFEIGDTRGPYWQRSKHYWTAPKGINDVKFLIICPICGGKTNGSAN